MKRRFKPDNSVLLYLLLLLACMNFLGRGPVIFLMFCIWGCFITPKVHIRRDKHLLYTTIMSIAAILVSCFFFDVKDIFKSTVYVLSFIVGQRLYLCAENPVALLKRVVFSAVLGYLFNLMLLYYLNFYVLGHVAGQRQLYNFWTNDYMAVTLAGMISCIPLAYSFYCLFVKKSMVFKLFGVLCIIVVFLINMGTATRTPFVLFILVYSIMLYELFRCNRIHNKIQVIVVTLLVSVGIAYKFLPILMDSALADRFAEEGVETSRMELTLLYIDNMLEYPWGGSNIFRNTKLLAHNVIFEAFDMYGFLFFIPFVLYLCTIFGRVYKLHVSRFNDDVGILLLVLYISVLVQLMLEPVISGYPQLVWTLFLIDGMSLCYLTRNPTKFKHQYEGSTS